MSTQIAKTIYEQLGGLRFSVMTGSKQLTALTNGLRVKLSRNKVNAGYMFVTLNETDTYTMTFQRVNGHTIAEFQNVYAEDLQRFFTDVTGLYTKL